jgi:hypothetical protein
MLHKQGDNTQGQCVCWEGFIPKKRETEGQEVKLGWNDYFIEPRENHISI